MIAVKQVGKSTVLTLVLTLLVYPAALSLRPVLNTGERIDFWFYWTPVLVGHLVCFILVAVSLRLSNQTWGSIGLDWGWFKNHWRWVTGILFVILVFAVFEQSPENDAPTIYQQVTLYERLIWVFGSILMASIVEEVVFRGYALTRLTSIFGSPWPGLLISVTSWVFIHRVPDSMAEAIAFSIAGLAFGGTFIYFKQRRLELLICFHALINTM